MPQCIRDTYKENTMAKTTELQVPNIACQHCAMTIKDQLSQIEGVLSVEVEVSAKTVTLEYDKASDLQDAKSRLETIGYPASS
jgi:copper chaperone CopZ